MADRISGPGASLPGDGTDGDFLVADTTKPDGVSWSGQSDVFSDFGFDPTTAGDWTVAPDTFQKALDELATRAGRGAPTVKTSAYTAVFGEVVRGDTTSAGFNVTLPAPKKNSSPVTVKRTAGSNNITVVGTIDAGTNTTVAATVKTFVALDDETGYVSF